MTYHNDSPSSESLSLPSDFGYWIECVPLRPRSWRHLDPGLYAASIDGLPDIQGLGISPDRAIAKLKRRLKALRRDDPLPDLLPRPHNRLRPPQRLQACQGWMSVYVKLSE